VLPLHQDLGFILPVLSPNSDEGSKQLKKAQKSTHFSVLTVTHPSCYVTLTDACRCECVGYW